MKHQHRPRHDRRQRAPVPTGRTFASSAEERGYREMLGHLAERGLKSNKGARR